MILAAMPVAADDKLEDIRGFLARNSLICADFTQNKLLAALSRPLVSTGSLIFVAGNGVLWQVREPFPARVLVKSDILVRWDDDGKPHRVDLNQAPIFQAISRLFLAVFAGKIEGLQTPFEISTRVSGERWRMTLIPRDPRLAAIIKRVRAAGGKFVEEVTIDEGRGDRTAIQFSGFSGETCQLSTDEKRYFAY